MWLDSTNKEFTMALTTIKRLHVFLTTADSQWSETGDTLTVSGSYGDKANDPSPSQLPALDIPGSDLPKGVSKAYTMDLSSLAKPAYYIQSLTIEIAGNDLWRPQTLIIFAENSAEYVYPVVEFTNWPDGKNYTWSTDSSEGIDEIKIFPLEIPRV